MEIVGIAGLIVGIISLVWMVRNWLDKRFKKLNRKLKKHDKADKRLAKRLDGVEESVAAVNGKLDLLILAGTTKEPV